MIRTSFTKKELAGLYRVTDRTLERYLNKGNLLKLLTAKGCLKYQKVIHPRLISVIFEYLGNPFR